MTVDTEAIFALVERFGPWGKTLEQLRGSMATAWVDERERGAVYLARGVGRPLWTGESREGIFFASTQHALEVSERFLGLRLRKRELRGGHHPHARGRTSRLQGALPPRPRVYRAAPPRRARAGRARVLLAVADRARVALAPAFFDTRPSGETS